MRAGTLAVAASSESRSAPTELPLFLAAKVGGAEDEHDESYQPAGDVEEHGAEEGAVEPGLGRLPFLLAFDAARNIAGKAAGLDERLQLGCGDGPSTVTPSAQR